ncbi:MAG: MFS transporter [Kiloniellales bacterium]|nr:MFS transporter [Kiloniellales bacterium]
MTSDAARSLEGAEAAGIGRRLPILCLNFGHAYAHLFMLIYPTVVLSLEADAMGSYGDLLLPATIGFVGFAAGTIPAGWLGDRWSRRGMLAVMFFGLGLGAIVTGLAQTSWQIGLGLGLLGLAASIYHPVGIAMLVEQARPLGRALGVNGVYGNMGVAAAPLLAAVLSESLGWRWAFFVPGVISLATGLLFVALPWRVAAASDERSDAAKSVDLSVLPRIFAYLLASAFFGGLIFNITTVSLPKLIDSEFGGWFDGPLGAGGLASAIFAVAAFTQIAVGWLIDRYPLKPLALLLPALQAPLLVAVILFSGLPSALAILGLMMIVFGEIPITDTLVARHSVAAWRARFYAVKYVLALGVGALAVPVIAWLHDPSEGFTRLYTLLAVMALCLASAALVLPRERRSKAGAAI